MAGLSDLLNFLGAGIGLLSGRSNIGAYFTISGSNDSVTLPISPSSFEVNNPYNNSTVNINNKGDMSMIGKRGLATLSISSFFPAERYGWETSYPILQPYEYVSSIESMANSGSPCKLSISGTSVSKNVTIESFKYGERDGTNDVYFTIELREYRFFTDATNDVFAITGLGGRMAETIVGKTVTMLPGMDVMDAARRAMQGMDNITAQQTKRIELYKGMIKHGGIAVGDVIHCQPGKISVRDFEMN